MNVRVIDPGHLTDANEPCVCGAAWQPAGDGAAYLDHAHNCAYLAAQDKEAVMTDGITVTLTFNLSEELLSDTMVTAFDGSYGGCWYWATTGSENWLTTNGESDVFANRWLKVVIQDSEDDDPKPVTVDHATLALGISRILNNDVKVSDDITQYILRAVTEDDAGDIDATAADCIVQAGIFNEIVYG